jgi:hypothetical protein
MKHILGAILTLTVILAPAAASAQGGEGEFGEKRFSQKQGRSDRDPVTPQEPPCAKNKKGKANDPVTSDPKRGNGTPVVGADPGAAYGRAATTDKSTVGKSIQEAINRRSAGAGTGDTIQGDDRPPTVPPGQDLGLAVVVLGDADYRDQYKEANGFQRLLMDLGYGGPEGATAKDRQTYEEAQRDFKARGYVVEAFDFHQFIDKPAAPESRAQLKRFLARLSDPRVKAFCFVGHGHERMARIMLGVGDLTADGAAKLRGKNPTDILILHNCYQGEATRAAEWKAAFQLRPDGFFKGWEALTNPAQNHEWQVPWE